MGEFDMIGPGGILDLINDNIEVVDGNIGEKTDIVVMPYVDGISSILAYLQTAYYHVHGTSFVLPDKAAPVTLNSSAAAWSETGAIVEVIPADFITKDFDLHWASLSDISATLDGIVDIFKGAPGEELIIGSVDVVRTANFSRENAAPAQVSQQLAGTRISCRFSDSTTSSRSVRVKFYGHIYGVV